MADPVSSADARRTRHATLRGAIAVATLAVVVAGSIACFGAQETFTFAYRLLRVAFLFVAH